MRPIRFIVIDDDSVNNMLCRVVIGKTTDDSEVKIFNFPEKGFEYIAKEYLSSINPTVLFLDINLPTWSGWEFLDHLEKLDEKIKKQIKIYVLSSSSDPKDNQRARENKNVVDYIAKPLYEKTVRSILDYHNNAVTEAVM